MKIKEFLADVFDETSRSEGEEAKFSIIAGTVDVGMRRCGSCNGELHLTMSVGNEILDAEQLRKLAKLFSRAADKIDEIDG